MIVDSARLKQILGLENTWQPVFRILPTKVEVAGGRKKWVMYKHLYRKYEPHGRGDSSYYRYRLPKDHFIMELSGKK